MFFKTSDVESGLFSPIFLRKFENLNNSPTTDKNNSGFWNYPLENESMFWSKVQSIGIYNLLCNIPYARHELLRYNSPFLEVLPADSWKAFVEIRW